MKVKIETTKDTLHEYSGVVDTEEKSVTICGPGGDHVVSISDLPVFYVEACSIIHELSNRLKEVHEQNKT